MRNKLKKRITAILASVCCLSVISVPVHADTVWFTLTLHHGGGTVGEPDDALSKKVLKNTDGDTKFWITQHGFDDNGYRGGYIKAYSQITGQNNLSKNYIKLCTANDEILQSVGYGWSYVPGGINYNINSEFGSGTINRAQGNYTP